MIKYPVAASNSNDSEVKPKLYLNTKMIRPRRVYINCSYTVLIRRYLEYLAYYLPDGVGVVWTHFVMAFDWKC